MTRIGVIGDPHGQTVSIDENKTDYLLIPGDMGSYQQARRVLSYYDDLDVPTYVVPGNHEVKNMGEDGFDTLLERYDSIGSVDGDCVSIDGYDVVGYGAHTFDLGPETLDEWDRQDSRFEDRPETYMERREILERTLDQSDNQTILLSHNVPLDSGVDTLDSPMAKKVGRYGLPYGSDVLSTVLEDREDVVLNVGGHIHEGRGLGKSSGIPVINAGLNDVTYVELDEDGITDIDFA